MASRIVAILLVGVLAVSVVVIARWRPQPLVELAEPRPVEVNLHGDELEWRSRATLEISVEEGRRLVSNGRLGLVTEMLAEPGARVSSGDAIAAVDGVVIRALATRAPLYREIRRGTRGEDVADVQQALIDGRVGPYDEAVGSGKRLGKPLVVTGASDQAAPLGEVNGSADAATMEAVAAFLGVESRRSTTLSPQDVIWLPAADSDVWKVSLEVGVPFPPLGTPIAIGAPSVTGAVVAVTDGSGGARPQQALRFESLDASVIVDLDADLTPMNLEMVEAMLMTDDSEVELTTGPIVIQGVVRATRPQRVVVAPTTALVVDADGVCVWLAGSSSRPQAVRVVGSSAVGVTYLDDLDLDGVRIVGNPIDLGLDSCSA
ncbi:MAG: hypothetical protein ACE5F5_11955 [Acidimicrobiia bacterium]